LKNGKRNKIKISKRNRNETIAKNAQHWGKKIKLFQGKCCANGNMALLYHFDEIDGSSRN